MDINGRTILLTGASGGLGIAIARDLAGRGAKLIISARNVAVLDDLAAETGAEVVVADLSNRADVAMLCARAASCDVLVANAGVGGDPALTDLDDDAIDWAIDVNLRAPISLANAFAQAHLNAGTPGQIVLIGSLAGLVTSPGSRLYNATKFGLRGFSLSFRQELQGTGIGCTLVAPGFIRDAGMFHDQGIELPPGVRTKSPEDVAAGVAKAIIKNPTEVFVSPAEMRVASTFGTVVPAITAMVQGRLGIQERRHQDPR